MTDGNGNGNGNKGAAGAARDPETDRARLRAIHAAMTGGDIAGAASQAEDALADGLDHVLVLSLVAAGAGTKEGSTSAEDVEASKKGGAHAPELNPQPGGAVCHTRMERWHRAARNMTVWPDPRSRRARQPRGVGDERWGGRGGSARLRGGGGARSGNRQ